MGLRGIAGRHARAGRKLANLSLSELASRSRVSFSALVELEDDALQPGYVHREVHSALERAGIEFLFAEQEGRIAVIKSDEKVHRSVAIGAGCGMLKWSFRTLCRRTRLSAQRLRTELKSFEPCPAIIKRCHDALSDEGCQMLRSKSGKVVGVELRPEFWSPSQIVFGPHSWKRWE